MASVCPLDMNFLSLSLQEFREVAKQYPSIKAEEMIVDNTCMQLTGRLNLAWEKWILHSDMSCNHSRFQKAECDCSMCKGP